MLQRGVLLFAMSYFLASADGRADAFKPFVSDVIHGGQSAKHLRLLVSGVEELSLIAQGVPDYSAAHADWADAKLIAADGSVTYLSDLSPIRVYQPYGSMRPNRSHRGGPITIAGKRFDRGIGTHAYSDLRFALGGKYQWFEAWIGVDVTAGHAGRVRFTVTDQFDIDPAQRLGPLQRPAPPKTVVGWRRWGDVDPVALRRAICDLIETFGPGYPIGQEYLARLDALEESLSKSRATPEQTEALAALREEALLANPLLDFDRLMLVKRRPWKNGKPLHADRYYNWDLGFPRSSTGNSSVPPNQYDNEIVVLSPVRPDGRLTSIYRPAGQRLVTDVDLHFDADRMLLSMRDDRGLWQVWEVNSDGSGLRQVSRGDQPDVDNYDACYLPDGGIIFTSSACFQAVPCNGSHVEVIYRMDADGGNVRQLCFEQDHDFNPVMLPNGRVMYLRWEYSDLPHALSRFMFTMNPDGTNQAMYYGGSSYWPNAIFGARPIPEHPTKFVGIVAGHHGSHRDGELVLFDVAQGRQEADGAIQRIPGYGKKVEPIVADQLTAASWPKFIHPYPLSDKYLLVTCKLSPQSPWDVCLVDVFDNIVPITHLDGYGLFEPIPLRKTPRPLVIPDKVDPSRDDATVYLVDVYRGEGLAGVPRGTVKRLRLYSFHFAYQGEGGLLGVVGLDGPWDIRRILGTVPVEPDGSAAFRIPANTPIAIQPLDEDGEALQQMRSWFVGMPGEVVSCVGCHESQNSTPPEMTTLASRRPPVEIEPWYGPPRNFSYRREVQPVIDKYCIGCHNGSENVDLRGSVLTTDYQSHIAGNGGGRGGRRFSVGYFELSRYVRRPGIESDLHLLPPLEFHADTTQLVQMLRKGHYHVKLDQEAWDRLITWIDLNAPFHGTWAETGGNPGTQRQRRRELRKLYAGVDEDPESLQDVPVPQVEPVVPEPMRAVKLRKLECEGWPFGAAEAAKRQAAAGLRTKRAVDLGNGVMMELTLIPSGEFVMGAGCGLADGQPLTKVTIKKAFWMGTCEVTNEQFTRFDPTHDSRFESKNGYQFGVTGFALNEPKQPVVRVSWKQAMAFCRWLSQETGRQFTLPSESQWEWACRAGTSTPWSYGDVEADFSPYANVADVALRRFATDPYTVYQPLPTFTKYDDWIPRDTRYDDRGLVSVEVGSYQTNAWGLCDMHGNVAEWTRSEYHASQEGRKVVRGGSWRDRPQRCRSAFRLAYPEWQGVYNVGFRVVCPE